MNLLFHAVCARPRASLHVLQSSSNVSQRVGLSLFLQHTALGDQLRQFSLETSLKRPLLRQHQQHRHKDLFLAHANCTLFCAPNAQKRTGSQQGKKTIFFGCFMNVILDVVK